jgi:hypothetical protein
MAHRIVFVGGVAVSIVLAIYAFALPDKQMPVNWYLALHQSVPLGAVWLALVAFLFWRWRLKALWCLLGAPAALYWPYVILVYGMPVCYFTHNCA